MHRHQNLLTATTTRRSDERRADDGPGAPGRGERRRVPAGDRRDHSAELLSLAMLGRRRGPLD